MSGEGAHRHLHIVRGAPTPEEIAVLVVVLAGASGGEPAQHSGVPGSQWAAPARLVRREVAPTGWWASSLPR